MSDIKQFITETVIDKHEGGYQSFKEDGGNYTGGKVGSGELVGTNYGISAPALKEYLGRDITTDDMKGLSKEDASSIMFDNFYKSRNIDKLPKELQKNVLDMVINSGSNGIKILQRGIGATPDGILGEQTIKKLMESGYTNDQYTNGRIKYYESISENNEKNSKFLKGWKNRAESFRTPKNISVKEQMNVFSEAEVDLEGIDKIEGTMLDIEASKKQEPTKFKSFIGGWDADKLQRYEEFKRRRNSGK